VRGELGEGQMWDAAMSAGQFGLGSLVCIVDRNGLSIDEPTEEIMGIEPLADKFASFRGVHVVLGPPAALYAHYQLDAAGIESAARQLLAGFGRPT
jgi:transketolase